ncbi:exosome component 10 isoform X2 [Ctenocephalides felis]|uniref:exosome component 10 isoform X2 n=1 Tax=Ctenocephalides felis TaxID=7515 RepID=UPI000E6E3324|nr:exosome component 10 isoform X2 [Ctenocephalides felis]
MENNTSIKEENKSINLQDDGVFDEFIKSAHRNIAAAISISNSFPQDQSWDLHAAHPAFVSAMSQMEKLTTSLMARVLKQERVKGNLHDQDTDEKYDLVLVANDALCEKIGSNLDELSGKTKSSAPVLIESSISTNEVIKSFSSTGTGSWNRKSTSTESKGDKIRLLSAHNIQKPQLTFKDKVDNSNTKLFVPKITDKPNSKKPLALEINEEGYTHPYDFELENFQAPEDQLTTVEPISPPPIEKTPLIYVDNEKSLNSMLRDLLNVKLFAVDLEHHSYRTFQGITCLMQISTRTCDYIVDTLILRDKLEILNEAFTKPDIVKIFHGGDLDIIWLQRDLGLYVVNMFDTHQAAKVLEFPRLSLAFLLNHYCSVDANKHFQLADWRMRPLPKELILYARQDTHYLLYIYDNIKNELISKANGKTNILESVISKSTEVCKAVYIKPKLSDNSHLKFYIKSKRMFDNRQLFALKEIYNWRDKIAREEDESTGYVLPNHMLLQICEALPREMQGILACCNPIPPLVRQNLMLLHQIILKAREQPLIKPILKEEIRTRGPEQKSGAINLDGPLHCPHDLSQQIEFRDDLPTLLGDLNNINMEKCFAHNVLAQKEVSSISKSIISEKPKLSIFGSPEHSEYEEKNHSLLLKLQKTNFVSPYQRYKSVRPFVESIEKDSINSDESKGNTANANEPVLSEQDKESIARVKQHFEILSKNTVQEVAATTSQSYSPQPELTKAPNKLDHTTPLRMRRKRKRVDSVDNTDYNHDQMSSNDISETGNMGDQSLSNDVNISYNEQEQTEKGSNRKRKRRPKKNPHQNSQQMDFKAFDYGSVDFQKYHGGSQQTSKPDEVKTKFNGKGKNKFNGYRNNKSLTFGKNKGKNNRNWKS